MDDNVKNAIVILFKKWINDPSEVFDEKHLHFYPYKNPNISDSEFDICYISKRVLIKYCKSHTGPYNHIVINYTIKLDGVILINEKLM